MMDPRLASKYEVIYETLTVSESDSETDVPADRRATGRRKVIKNFIICNPAVSKKSSNKKPTDSAGFSEILSEPSSVGKTNENELNNNFDRCLNNSIDENVEKSITQEPTSSTNDSCSLNGSLRKEKQKLNETNWANAVNSIEKGGPSLEKIKNVIEKTIFRVLNEDLAASNTDYNSAIDTNKKKCPHCEFQTFSRFSLKKHVALHENKPQLVFSQGIPEKPADSTAKTSLAAKKFVCCKCSDLFRTEIALKRHNCDSLVQTVNTDIKLNKLTTLNSDVNSTQESTIVTALKFLRKKPFDIETRREEVNVEENSKVRDKKHFKRTLLNNKKLEQQVLLASTNKKAASKTDEKVVESNVVGHAKDIRYLRKILEEPVETGSNSCSSVSSTSEKKAKMDEREIKIEPFEIVWEEVDEDCKNELFDENIQVEPEDSQCDSSTSNMYDDLERRMAILTGEEDNDNDNGEENTNSDSVNGQNSNNNNNNNNKVNDYGSEITWNSSSSYFIPKTNQKISDERQRFNDFANKWLESYKKVYPNLSARVHVPGGIACPDCQVYYKSFHLLKRHWGRIHDPSVPVLRCPKCDYKTAQRGLLISHLRHKHDEAGKRIKYQCDKCEKNYYSSTRLKRHKLYNHTDTKQLILYKCEKCSYSAFDTKNLHKHFERKHLNNNEKTYLCMYCGKLAKTKYAMQLHEKSHEGITKIYKCKSCCIHFEHRYDLYSHEHIVHAIEKIYFNCKSCDYKTLNKELLVVHENETHKNVKKFKCSDCNTLLKDLESLRIHITRKHNPYVPWKYCAHCSYKSRKKGALSSHCIKHLPRKRGHIKCKLCNYRTYKKHYYERHFNIRHNPNAVLYYCYHCGYSNKVKAKLHQHMQFKNHLLTS